MIEKQSLKKLFLPKDASLIDAMHLIQKYSSPVALVTSSDGKLHGVITDGDIRRFILKKNSLQNTFVKDIMNSSPIYLSKIPSYEDAKKLMIEKDIEFVPILINKKVKYLFTLKEINSLSPYKSTSVLIMAGGLGSRLNELTKNNPKPLMLVNGKPILEHIILSLKSQGFSDFHISINYLAKKIKSYFKDGSSFGVNIHYLEEKEPLGTGGSIGLLESKNYGENLIVMNGDLITNFDFRNLVREFKKTSSDLLMCVANYQHKIPFGVVEKRGKKIKTLNEKPVLNFLINAGIYILSKKIVKNVKKERIDMTDIILKEIKRGSSLETFKINEYWIDIGNKNDLSKANEDISNNNAY